MSMIRSLFVPGWSKIIPGLLFCAAFAFIIMNVDHVLSKYHKADVAYRAIPGLEEKLAAATAEGVSMT